MLDAGLLGAQEPRICRVPDFVSSAGREAIELAALADLHLDAWEQFVLVNACGERADGRWASFEVGLVAPRQNGKGAILEARELAGLFLFGEQLLIHSAHEQATSSEHFRRLLMLIESVPEFDRRVLRAPKGKGFEAIELRGGQRIFFKTRTGGGGRGLTGDFVALDEAMILPEATTAALVPTMAARSIHGNPQLWYAGSAVDQRKHEHGVVLSRVRARGLAGKARVAYFEWSAEGDDPDALTDEERGDEARWAEANPGLGIRISLEHIANECAGALGPREFAVERLGVGDWPLPDGSQSVINLDDWNALIADGDPKAARNQLGSPLWFAFDVPPDRSSASISVAGKRPDGLHQIETVDLRRGTGWVATRLAELVSKHQPAGVLCDAAGPAGSLLPECQQLGVTVTLVSAREYGQACGLFYDHVVERRIRHLAGTEMTAAIKAAAQRPLGEAWAWSRKTSADISPLVAATLALWGAAAATPSPFTLAW